MDYGFNATAEPYPARYVCIVHTTNGITVNKYTPAPLNNILSDNFDILLEEPALSGVSDDDKRGMRPDIKMNTVLVTMIHPNTYPTNADL